MTEIEDIQRDLKAIHERYSKWYNDNILSINYNHTYPYVMAKHKLGGAIVAIKMVVKAQKGK